MRNGRQNRSQNFCSTKEKTTLGSPGVVFFRKNEARVENYFLRVAFLFAGFLAAFFLGAAFLAGLRAAGFFAAGLRFATFFFAGMVCHLLIVV